jgi:membrane-associated protein
MDLHFLVDFILKIDEHLIELVNNYGLWTYVILFLIIFAETGLVVAPILPGDSLLFAAGSLAAVTVLDPAPLFFIIAIAAILGDSLNYFIGNKFSGMLLNSKQRIIKIEHIDKTQEFYKKYGVKTIIIARFVPFVRTFAPFVAGVGKMDYKVFMIYNIIGAVVWAGSLVYLGFYFGNLEFVKNNFKLVALAIILISLLPIFFELIKHKLAKGK